MHLSKMQHQDFWHRGWMVVESVFAVEEVDSIAQLATRLCERELYASDSTSAADRSNDGLHVAPRKLGSPFTKSPEFAKFVLDPRLRSLVKKLTGQRALLCVDQIMMKPPHFGSAKPYHQDNAYFLCHPDDDVITAWIALDDVDESNGCLRYIEGSHLGPILNHEPLPNEGYNKVPAVELIDLKKETAACVKKGGVVFHHCKTLHTSHRNNSSNWRRGYATHWVSDRVVSENDTIKNGYFHAHEDLYQATIAELTSRSTSL